MTSNEKPEKKEKIFSVSELRSGANLSLQLGSVGGLVAVRGELGSVNAVPFKDPGKNGTTVSFNLKEGKASVKCIEFKWGIRAEDAGRIHGEGFRDGAVAIVYGEVAINDWGAFQLKVERIRLEDDEIGEWEKKRRELDERFEKLGYYRKENKKEVPRYPEIIGIVTSGNGKAITDFVEHIRAREAGQKILFRPAAVQGDLAPAQISEAIMALESYGVDVIVVGRGGGDKDDLRAFDTEEVAEAIRMCTIPVVTAIGHTADASIADKISDYPAGTPTAVGLYLIPKDAKERLDEIRKETNRLRLSMMSGLKSRRSGLQRQETRLAQFAPEKRLHLMREQTARLRERMDHRMEERIRSAQERCRDLNAKLPVLMDGRLTRIRHRYELLLEKLRVRSPIERLRGGYGFVTGADGHAVTSVGQVRERDEISVRLRDGRITAGVKTVSAEAIAQEE